MNINHPEIRKTNPLWDRLKKPIILITYTCVLVFLLFNMDVLWSIIAHGISLVVPFFAGMGIALVVNVFVKLYENYVFAFLNKKDSRLWKKCRRGVCVFLSFLTLLLILLGILFFVIPELISSITRFTANAPSYAARFSQEVYNLLSSLNITQDQINSLRLDWSSLISQATQFTTNLMTYAVNATMTVANGVFITAMSFIFSCYMLFGKERLTTNLKRVVYAFLPKIAAHQVVEIGILSNRIFSNFVRGLLTEAVVWFFLCYISMSLLGLPYALLLSTLVALCSMIPIIGPYISMFTGGFILLLVNPWNCATFIVMFLILQQIEGNLIYPRVVGTSVGLPGIWVLLSIIAFGNLLGIVGILLGIPITSIAYTLLKNATAYRLRDRNITTEQILRNDPDWSPEDDKAG